MTRSLVLPELVEFTQTLLRRCSISPDDAGCQLLLEDRLASSGFQIHALPSGKVSNLWARFGQHAPLLVFAGHTDVVSAPDAALWRASPFAGEIVEGHLIGRGAQDMKGAVGAAVMAAESLVKRYHHLDGSLGFMLTSGEEGDDYQNGTPKLVEYLRATNQRVDWCLLGEPSSMDVLGDKIRIGRRGSLNCEALFATNSTSHVAHCASGENLIHRVMAFFDDLTSTGFSVDALHPLFPPTYFNVTNISAGTGESNLVPNQVRAKFNFRFHDGYTPASIIGHVEQRAKLHQLNVSFDWEISGHPFISPEGRLLSALKESIAQICGLWDPLLAADCGTSDGRFIIQLGCEVVEFGTRNHLMHKRNEAVALEELFGLYKVYYTLFEKLLITPERRQSSLHF